MWKTIAPSLTGICSFLAVAALALSVVSAAETNMKDKDAVVREIDFREFTRARIRRLASNPTRITNHEEHANSFPEGDEDWRDRIASKSISRKTSCSSLDRPQHG